VRIAAALAVLVAPFLVPTTAQQTTRATPRLHPDMERVIAEIGPAKGWVFFTDKNLEAEQRRVAALDDARAHLSPRAIERRRDRRVLPGLVDERDADLAPAYVEAVLATGVEPVVESRWLNAISVRGTLEQFRRIAELPCVARVEPVRRGRILEPCEPAPVAPVAAGAARGSFYGLSEAQLQQIGITDLHARGYTANGIVVGILDTGFHRGHEAFNQSGHVVDVIAEHDFINNDGNTDIQGGDDGGQHVHGTYILGTLGAYLPGELVGGAYDASFILCKTEDVTNEYQQEEDFYAAGIEFIENNGGDLATSSLGYIDWYTQSDLDGQTAVTTLAVNAATDNGMPCVTAAGNFGHDTNPATSTLIAPADALEVITAGAVDSAGVIASFSSDGPTADVRPKPELLATGVSTATVCANSDSNCTTFVSGTSLSTPLLAGVVACLLDAHPTFTVGQLRARLLRTGNYFEANGTFDPQYVLGYGIPDADQAGFDCNGNGLDDALDIAQGTEFDCNGNGFPDRCDIADGISLDADGDHWPDECPRPKLATKGPPGGIRTVELPLVAVPPGPRVGGRLLLSSELPIVAVEVRSEGVDLGLVRGPRTTLADGRTTLEIALPDSVELAGRTLELRGAARDSVTGGVRWTYAAGGRRGRALARLRGHGRTQYSFSAPRRRSASPATAGDDQNMSSSLPWPRISSSGPTRTTADLPSSSISTSLSPTMTGEAAIVDSSPTRSL